MMPTPLCHCLCLCLCLIAFVLALYIFIMIRFLVEYPPYVAEVVNLYFGTYIPLMIANGQQMRTMGKPYAPLTSSFLLPLH